MIIRDIYIYKIKIYFNSKWKNYLYIIPFDKNIFKPKLKESNNINLFSILDKKRDLTINNDLKELYPSIYFILIYLPKYLRHLTIHIKNI